MTTETKVTGKQFRVQTAGGAWVFVDAHHDGEWDRWNGGVSFGAHSEATPEDALRVLAEQARAFADAVLGAAPPGGSRGE
jgi:hypothetical protein